MYLKPADGRAPRDPQTGMRIPATGQAVSEHDPHWAMLRRDGDVVECDPPKEAPVAGDAEAAAPAHGAAKTLAEVRAASAARSQAIEHDDAAATEPVAAPADDMSADPAKPGADDAAEHLVEEH